MLQLASSPQTRSLTRLSTFCEIYQGGKHQPSAPAGPSRWAGLQGRAKVWLREAKAALSSELEGVITKATRPDDKQVKLKHLEPLLAISYQTAPQVDPYAPVLR